MQAAQPRISARSGAAWIEARYDHGAMPEAVSRTIRALRGRPAPSRETAMSAAFARARLPSAVHIARLPKRHA